MLLLPMLAHPQSTQLPIAAFDGKSGKPLPSQRLLISSEEPRKKSVHKRSLDVVTGTDGSAGLN